MTETQVSCRFEKACSSYLPNRTLEAAMYQAVCHYGTPAWSDEERAFAAAIRATLSANDINNSLNNIAGTSGEEGKTFARRHRDTLLIDEVAPWAATDNVLAGSTDVGDVSWKAPVAQCFSPCFAVGTPLHSWQLVSQGRTSIAHKGMLLAGKVPRGDRHPFIQRQRPAGGQPARAQAGTGRTPLSLPDPGGGESVRFTITT